MPTVLRVNGYRFFFSNEEGELKHVHVEKAASYAKFWIEPIELEASRGFNNSELKEVQELIIKNINLLTCKWDEHFSQ
jgi:hypothetical protein